MFEHFGSVKKIIVDKSSMIIVEGGGGCAEIDVCVQ